MTALGFHASMFGFLAKMNGKQMVDPLDKPATRLKTLKRIEEFLFSAMFTKGSEVVDNGCSMSIIEIIQHVFPEFLTEDKVSNLTSFFIKPLLEIVNPKVIGNTINQQLASCYCLRRLVEYLVKEHKDKMLVTP